MRNHLRLVVVLAGLLAFSFGNHSTIQAATACYSVQGSAGLPVLTWPLEGSMSDYSWPSWNFTWTWGSCGGSYKRHAAVDISRVSGTIIGKKVYAAYDGVVKAWKYNGGSGWKYGVVVQHTDLYGNPFTTTYLHIDPISPGYAVGSTITRGTQIGTVADINISGDHLHFGIRRSAYSAVSKRGALPVINQASCKCNDGNYNDPVHPEYFIDPSTATYTSSSGNNPYPPTMLAQYYSNGVTALPLGGSTTESTVVMKGGVADPNNDAVKLQVEVIPTAQAFTGTPSSNCAGGFYGSGTTATVTCNSLAAGAYHWQGRSMDQNGLTSSWVSAGNNTEADADFTVNQCFAGSIQTGHWLGEYFNNKYLGGSPVMTRDDGIAFLNFQWGNGGPGVCGVPSDYFSGRFTTSRYFDAGTYRFSAQADDGVKLYVDNVLYINGSYTANTYTADVNLSSGNHSLRVEYFEDYGGALVTLSWVRIDLPTLTIDGGTSSSRYQLQTFSFAGTHFSPYSHVTRYMEQPNGTTIVLTPDLYTDGSGNISWTFTPPCSTPAGTYKLRAVDDPTGTSSNEVYEIVLANSGCTCTTTTQLLQNPGFEAGNVSWTTTSGVIDTTIGYPHSGYWKAKLNGKGYTSTDYAYQQVSIPSDACSATLDFWVWVDSAENPVAVYDRMNVDLLNTSGTLIATLMTLTNLDKSSGYAERTLDLSAYKGQTLILRFYGTEDYSIKTTFFVDDVLLNVIR